MLRELMRGPAMDETLLRAMYALDRRQAERVEAGLRTRGILYTALRELRAALQDFSVSVSPVRWSDGHPVEWALHPASQPPLRSPLENLLDDLPPVARRIVQALAEAGDTGLATSQLIRRVYGRAPPSTARTSLSVTITNVRGKLRQHGFYVMTWPRAGALVRRRLAQVQEG